MTKSSPSFSILFGGEYLKSSLIRNVILSWFICFTFLHIFNFFFLIFSPRLICFQEIVDMFLGKCLQGRYFVSKNQFTLLDILLRRIFAVLNFLKSFYTAWIFLIFYGDYLHSRWILNIRLWHERRIKSEKLIDHSLIIHTS